MTGVDDRIDSVWVLIEIHIESQLKLRWVFAIVAVEMGFYCLQILEMGFGGGEQGWRFEQIGDESAAISE